MLKGVIFDMDGLMIDTEKLLTRFWCEAANHYGYPMTKEHVLGIRSLAAKYAIPHLKGIFGEDFDYYKVRAKRIELMNEFMMLGFRMLDGPDFALFKRKFDRRAEEVFKERLYGLESRGLITGTDGACGRGYGLTRKGLDFANIIFEEFI